MKFSALEPQSPEPAANGAGRKQAFSAVHFLE
jgi:hypothetical protein